MLRHVSACCYALRYYDYGATYVITPLPGYGAMLIERAPLRDTYDMIHTPLLLRYVIDAGGCYVVLRRHY